MLNESGPFIMVLVLLVMNFCLLTSWRKIKASQFLPQSSFHCHLPFFWLSPLLDELRTYIHFLSLYFFLKKKQNKSRKNLLIFIETHNLYVHIFYAVFISSGPAALPLSYYSISLMLLFPLDRKTTTKTLKKDLFGIISVSSLKTSWKGSGLLNDV